MAHSRILLCFLLSSFSSYGDVNPCFNHGMEKAFNTIKGRAETSIILSKNIIPGSKLELNDAIPIDSVVVLPVIGEKGFLEVTFKKRDISLSTISDIFLNPNNSVIDSHPFTRRGVQAILTENLLILKIFSGVVVRISSELPGMPDYRIFNGREITGKVTNLFGEVYSISNSIVEKCMPEFTVAYRVEIDLERSGIDEVPYKGKVKDHESLPELYSPVLK
ncbi:MAG: hypothetical protein GY820_47235 [Gammaproteobacteria bacterium]|nr:hypothetical protein [Gammaproteobacteria bacterium]